MNDRSYVTLTFFESDWDRLPAEDLEIIHGEFERWERFAHCVRFTHTECFDVPDAVLVRLRTRGVAYVLTDSGSQSADRFVEWFAGRRHVVEVNIEGVPVVPVTRLAFMSDSDVQELVEKSKITSLSPDQALRKITGRDR